MILVIIFIIIERAVTNPFFQAYMLLGVIWFVTVAIVKKKINDPKESRFSIVRVIVGVTYWVMFLILMLFCNFIAGPIRFM